MPRMLFVALTLICWALPVKAEVLAVSCDGTMKAEDQEKPHAITKMGLIVNFDAGVRLEGLTNQFVVDPHQEIVGLGIEPRHGRTKRACDPVHGAMD